MLLYACLVRNASPLEKGSVMETALSQKYELLTELNKLMFDVDPTDGNTRRQLENMGFENINYRRSKAIRKASNAFFSDDYIVDWEAGRFENGDYEALLDKLSIEFLADDMIEFAFEPQVGWLTFALLMDLMKISPEGVVKELVVSVPVGDKLVGRMHDDVGVDDILRRRRPVIFFSPNTVKYLERHGQFAHPAKPETMRPLGVKLVDALHRKGCQVFEIQ